MGTCPTYSTQEHVYKKSNLLIFGTAQVSMRQREERKKKKKDGEAEKKKGRRGRGKKKKIGEFQGIIFIFFMVFLV